MFGNKKGYTLLLLSLLFSFTVFALDSSPVAGKTICIDPGHGGTSLTDSYRVGPGGNGKNGSILKSRYCFATY